MVAGWRGRPSVPDHTPRAAVRTYHQLGTGAELPPLSGDVRRFQRLNAVACAVADFQRGMMMDIDQVAQALGDAEIQDFIEGFNQPTYRGMRINGVRVATWSSEHGWSGDSSPEVRLCGLDSAFH
jgi:hypothetical protein